MRALTWLIRAAIFFVLFAFALNNQHEAALQWFFGHQWRAPMVFIVLAAFTLGCAFGVLAMVPSWWRHRREAQKHQRPATPVPGETVTPPATDLTTLEHPPRDGL